MFIRFVVSERHTESQQKMGVLQAAYKLLREEELGDEERAELRRLLDWFNKNLPAPRKTKPREIFWFKLEAEEHAEMIWQLACLLAERGMMVELIKTERPGYVIYEDEFQVGAIPFKDTI